MNAVSYVCKCVCVNLIVSKIALDCRACNDHLDNFDLISNRAIINFRLFCLRHMKLFLFIFRECVYALAME